MGKAGYRQGRFMHIISRVRPLHIPIILTCPLYLGRAAASSASGKLLLSLDLGRDSGKKKKKSVLTIFVSERLLIFKFTPRRQMHMEGPVLPGTVKNVTELGMHGRRNFLAGREFISTVCQEEKERERKVSEG